MPYNSRSRRTSRPGTGGPPAWLVVLVAVALVFGLYYLWQGVQNFFRTGGRGVVEATERAVTVNTATAERVQRANIGSDATPRPTNTPVPECQDFVVSVPNAIIRETPSTNGAILTSLNQGSQVCVLEHLADSEWYVIDQTPGTRRLDLAYMHETVLRAVNPTLTPTRTTTPLPTVTPTPTETPSLTPSPQPSQPTATPTEDENAAPTLPPPEMPTLPPAETPTPDEPEPTPTEQIRRVI